MHCHIQFSQKPYEVRQVKLKGSSEGLSDFAKVTAQYGKQKFKLQPE